MHAGVKKLVGLAALLAVATTGHAAITDELPGNLFRQTGAPADGNVSIAINRHANASTGSGGTTVTGEPYPIGTGNSPLLDGNVLTGVTSATIDNTGAMANYAVARGFYDSQDVKKFTNVPFTTEIGLIRIWAQQSKDSSRPSGYWHNFPMQVKVAYTASNVNIENGGTLNSDTLGVTPSAWGLDATISSVNGHAPTSPADPAYDPALGWVNLEGLFAGLTVSETNSNVTYGYVDLAVGIPAGATSVLISFGGNIYEATGSQGGLQILDFQASAIPEPASFGVLGMVGAGLMLRRRNKA